MIVIFGEGKGWFNTCFKEVSGDANIIVSQDCYSPFQKSKIERFFFHLVFHPKLGAGNKRDDVIAKLLYRKVCVDMRKKCSDKTVLIFNRTNHLSHNRKFLSQVKKEKRYKMVYWFTDIVEAVMETEPDILDICNSYYDNVVTYDPEDAQKYGFHYVETPYSKLNAEIKTNASLKTDLFYVGKAKMSTDPLRFQKIISVYEKARKLGLTTEFYVFDVPEQLQLYKEEIHYNCFLPYETVVKKIQESRCILEITQCGERGTTLRFFEAIAYQKKLLFSNAKLSQHKLFNGNHMKLLTFDSKGEVIFEEEFIRNTDEISYDNEAFLSPYRFLDEIVDLLR